MIFSETNLEGAFIIDVQPRGDARGLFARTFCAQEFAAHGLISRVVQSNLSQNVRRGTVRGMHYQIAPRMETKLVRCTRGAILDVIVDLRPESPTYRQHIGVELTAANRRALFVPQMFAHGYQTLEDDIEVEYHVSEFYAPECERGLRHDDPALAIAWPLPVAELSEKDGKWALLDQPVPGASR